MLFHEGEPGEEPAGCPLCDDAFPQAKKLVKDHCHRCRYFRSWLCEVCNSYLGRVEYYQHKRQRWLKHHPELFWWLERADFYLGAHICDWVNSMKEATRSNWRRNKTNTKEGTA